MLLTLNSRETNDRISNRLISTIFYRDHATNIELIQELYLE